MAVQQPKISLPNLSTGITREQFLLNALVTNNSESALLTKTWKLKRLDVYSKNIHKMTTDQVIVWINSHPDKDERIQLGVNFLYQYVEFCRIDHPEIIRNTRILKNPKVKRAVPLKNTTLTKLHRNSFAGYFSIARAYLSQVGGIRLHDDDLISIRLPITLKRGAYDDEEAEPLTATQARKVLGHLEAPKTIAACEVMNDTAFRVTETGLTQEKHIHFETEPCSIDLPGKNAKGGKAGGTRYIRDTTALHVKALMTGDPEHYVFRTNDKQTRIAFRVNILDQLRDAYDKEGMTEIYEDSKHHKYNTHSWRARAGTEYKRANGEDLSHGYLRHTKHLAQYMKYTKEERIEAFKKAEIDLAIDEIDKKNLEIERVNKENTKLKESEALVKELEKEREEWKKQQAEVTKEQVIELVKKQYDELNQKKSPSK